MIDPDGFRLFFGTGNEVAAPEIFHIVKEKEPAGGEFKVVIAVRVARLDEELHAGIGACLIAVLAGDGADVLILNAEEGIDKLIVIQHFQVGHGAVRIVLLPFFRAVPFSEQTLENVILGIHTVGNGDGVGIFPLGIVFKIAIQCHGTGRSFYDETHDIFPAVFYGLQTYMDVCDISGNVSSHSLTVTLVPVESKLFSSTLGFPSAYIFICLQLCFRLLTVPSFGK